MLADKEGKQLNEYIKDYVIYDLETTGISVQNDCVVEISAVKVINGKVVDEFSTLVNPQMPIPYHATRVNGITNEMVADAPTFCEALDTFLEFIGDMVLVGHNIHTFDMKFIYRDCMNYFGKIPDNDYVDTLKLARAYLPKLSHYKLTDLASYYAISSEGAHRALNDCRMNQQVFEYLGKEMKENIGSKDIVKKCPLCGEFLKKRSGRFGDFYGCLGFPKCRYTENI